MRSAALVKAMFATVVMVALLVSTFLQAKAVVTSIASWLAPASRPRATSGATVLEPQPPPQRQRSELVLPAAASARPAEDESIVVRECRGLAATIVTESSDATFSAAVLKASSESRGRSRRVGDVVGGWKVELIGFNARANTPAIWFSKGRAVCRLDLFAQPAPEAPEHGRNVVAGPVSSVPREMAARVLRVSESELRVERAFVEWVLEDPSTLMREVRVLPEKQEAGPTGLRLVRMRPDGLLALIGLRQGDLLISVNGFELANPERALEAFARLRVAPRLEVRVVRAGSALTIEYEVL